MSIEALVKKHNDLGIDYETKELYNEAIVEYKKCIEIDPYYPEAILNLGVVLIKVQNYSQAVKEIQKVLKMSPRDRTAREYLGIAKRCLREKKYFPRIKRSKHLQVLACDSIKEKKLDHILKQGEKAIFEITRFLNEKFAKTIFMEVHPRYSPVPRIEISDRPIHLKIGVDPFNAEGPLIMHEMTHAIAFNYNRFFAEGLAIFMQYKFTKERVWPFPDLELEELMIKYGEVLFPLNKLVLETNGNLIFFSLKVINSFKNRLAYIESGSFVKFLIEEQGLRKFKSIYKIVDDLSISPQQARALKEVYGISLTELEEKWLEKTGVVKSNFCPPIEKEGKNGGY